MPGRIYRPCARAILEVIFDGHGRTDDSEPKLFPVLPKEVEIHENSYRMPDTWSLTFEANDLPIDPSSIRAGAVRIYLYNREKMGDDQEVVSRQFATTDSGKAHLAASTIDTIRLGADAAEAERFVQGNSPRMMGLFDDHSLKMDGGGKWVTIRGQDYTALFTGKQWPPTASGHARKIPVGKRLDKILADIVREADPSGRLFLSVEHVDPTTLPVVGASEVNTNKRGIPVEAQTTYWDVMYKLATRYGFILFVRNLDVILTKPKNLDDARKVSRRMVWGHNVESLELTRHLAKERAPRIVVKGYDPVTRRTITVEFPDTGLKSKLPVLLKGKPAAKTSTTVKIKGAAKKHEGKTHHQKVQTLHRTDEYTIIPIYGISDRLVLQRAAENIHNLLGKGERRIIMSTHDLLDADDADLLDVHSGDSVSLDWADKDSAELLDPTTPEAVKYQDLIARGYSPDVAQVIARYSELLLTQKRPLRVREKTTHYAADGGLDIEMELIDFVAVDGVRNAGQREPSVDKHRRAGRHADGSHIGNQRVTGKVRQ